jgi:hypothetical protein
LALNEACQLLEERAGRVDVSDDGMDWEGDDDDESASPESEEVDPEELVNDFELIIKGYSKSEPSVSLGSEMTDSVQASGGCLLSNRCRRS